MSRRTARTSSFFATTGARSGRWPLLGLLLLGLQVEASRHVATPGMRGFGAQSRDRSPASILFFYIYFKIYRWRPSVPFGPEEFPTRPRTLASNFPLAPEKHPVQTRNSRIWHRKFSPTSHSDPKRGQAPYFSRMARVVGARERALAKTRAIGRMSPSHPNA